MGVIYKIVNLVNGRIYIGKRVFNSNKFMNSNYFGSGRLLKQDISKYGINSFIRGIIEEVELSSLEERERFWIKHYNSNNLEIGYNLTTGGNGNGYSGWNHTQNTIDKIKIKRKDQKPTFLNKNHSEESKDKIRNKLKDVPLSEETKQKMKLNRKGMLDKNHTQESKDKISKTRNKIKVIQMTLLGEVIKIHDSICEAARFINGYDSNIRNVCIGKYKQYKGYKFEFYDIKRQ